MAIEDVSLTGVACNGRLCYLLSVNSLSLLSVHRMHLASGADYSVFHILA
jgi:hypothetical protein